MNTFVILFRRCEPALPANDRQRLTEETSFWARMHNAAGHALDPRILAADSAWLGAESESLQQEPWKVSAILFLQAKDLDEAGRVAGEHPALRYGFNIEVRPWAAPGAVPPR